MRKLFLLMIVVFLIPSIARAQDGDEDDATAVPSLADRLRQESEIECDLETITDWYIFKLGEVEDFDDLASVQVQVDAVLWDCAGDEIVGISRYFPIPPDIRADIGNGTRLQVTGWEDITESVLEWGWVEELPEGGKMIVVEIVLFCDTGRFENCQGSLDELELRDSVGEEYQHLDVENDTYVTEWNIRSTRTIEAYPFFLVPETEDLFYLTTNIEDIERRFFSVVEANFLD